jgi:drug/metabolite transporter (DMT)-like permease
MGFAYIYLFIGLACISILGILHKLADVKKCRSSAINALLFVWSFSLLFSYTRFVRHETVIAPLTVSWIAILFGICAAVAILAFQEGIKYGQIATSWLIINLSAGLPTLASIVVYHEAVNVKKVVALFLIAISIFLIWKDKKAAELMVEVGAPE